MEIKNPKPLKTFLFKNGLTNKIRNIIKLHVEWFYTFKCKKRWEKSLKTYTFFRTDCFCHKVFRYQSPTCLYKSKVSEKIAITFKKLTINLIDCFMQPITTACWNLLHSTKKINFNALKSSCRLSIVSSLNLYNLTILISLV